MNNVLEEIFKERDYVFKRQLFKVVLDYELDINAFILLLYFLNQSRPSLNIKDIKNVTFLNEKDILSSFSLLSSKGLVSVKIVKENGKSNEIIDLDNTFKSMVVNINNKLKSDAIGTIFDVFEKEFGRSLSPMELEMINGWISSGVSEEIIKGALKEATYNGVSNFRYIDKIIFEWSKKGFKSMDDVSNYLKKRESSKEEKILFDYNWLEDE